MVRLKFVQLIKQKTDFYQKVKVARFILEKHLQLCAKKAFNTCNGHMSLAQGVLRPFVEI